jgi:hypothetical protein
MTQSIPNRKSNLIGPPVKRGQLARLVQFSLAVSFLAVQGAWAQTAQPVPIPADGWEVTFDPATSSLDCRHLATGNRLAGPLAFTASQGGGAPVAWTIQPARDSVSRRLALVDPRNDVQGYLNILGDGNRLSLSVLPRPRQNYSGELTFTAETTLGAQAFACRTRLPEQSLVLQMASGPSDSLLNESLFDPQRDLAVRFSGRQVSISTHPAAGNLPPTFRVRISAAVLKPGVSEISMEMVPDYYRARYVPDYRLIDRKRAPTPPTGWMSWNAYFDVAGEKENLEEARIAARLLKPFGLQIWSIESWQENSLELPVSRFYNLTLRASPVEFPHGMKWLAQQIRDLGFRPGIWTVPFGTGDAHFYETHKKWFLHDTQGQPMRNWCGRYLLDPSQAAVRQHMEETHRIMSAEWGYEFFKIDGMSGTGPGYSAHFFERPEVRAAFQEPCQDPYRLSIEALRRGIGPDRILLACQGHYTGPDVAVADASRVGSDIVTPGQPPHWENYLNQARISQAQLFTNNLVWYTDPDTLMVGQPTPLGVARIAATVVALPGQLTFFGDKLGALSAQRMRLLQSVLPVCDVHPLDLLPIADLKPVWDLKVRRPFATWDVVSMFNWGEEPREYNLPFADLGLDGRKEYLLYEFWSRKLIGVARDSIKLRVDPRSNLLLAVHPLESRPQFLSTDRHISQGGVELTALAWNADRGELSGKLQLVANDPLTMAVHVPAGYRFSKAVGVGAAVENVSHAGPVTSVVLRSATSGEAGVVLTFVPPATGAGLPEAPVRAAVSSKN